MNHRLKAPAIKDGRVQVVTIPQGSSVVVQPKAAK